jgi:hypothetical protein
MEACGERDGVRELGKRDEEKWMEVQTRSMRGQPGMEEEVLGEE